MDQEGGDIDRHQPLVQFLSLVREVAADAAAQADPDLCLRHLRTGLIRLGFLIEDTPQGARVIYKPQG